MPKTITLSDELLKTIQSALIIAYHEHYPGDEFKAASIELDKLTNNAGYFTINEPSVKWPFGKTPSEFETEQEYHEWLKKQTEK